VLCKAELKERLAKSCKGFDDENKVREKALSKTVRIVAFVFLILLDIISFI